MIEVRATGRVRVSFWLSVRVTVEFRVRVNARLWFMTTKRVQARVRIGEKARYRVGLLFELQLGLGSGSI